jgi:branched-chain amino acid transport system substrate-binding protein
MEEFDSILMTCHSSNDMNRDLAITNRRLFIAPAGADQEGSLPGFYFFDELGMQDEITSWYGLPIDYDWGWETNAMCQITLEKHDPGIEYLGAVGCPDGAADYLAQLRTMMSKKPSMVVASPWGGDGVVLLRQAEQMGLFEQDWFKVWFQVMGGSTDTAEGITADVKAGAFHGKLYATARYLWNQNDSPSNVKFVNDFKAKNEGRYPNYSAANAYATLMCFKAAIERVGSLDMQAIIKAMEDYPYQGPEGERSFRKYDHMSQYTVPAGQYTYDANVANIAFLGNLSKTPWTTYFRKPPDYTQP